METLREVYLTVFVLFFRIGQHSWSVTTNAAKGAAGITWLQFMLLITGSAWLYFFTGDRRLITISSPLFYVSFGAIYLLNYYTLVARQTGLRFESAFKTMRSRHRSLLVVTGVGFIVFSFGLALFSAYYVHAHGSLHP